MEERNKRLQYFIALSVSVASFAVGAGSAWPTPVLPKLSKNETELVITQTEIAWVVAVNAPGFMFGSLVTRFVSELLGRRITILTSSLSFIIGTLLVLCISNVWLLYIARFLWGIGTGMVGTVVPMYIAEVADKEIRGSLSLSTSVMFNLGNLLMMITGPFLSYNILNMSLLVFPLCYVVTCWWIPESPYYLFKVGKLDEARKVILRLKGLKDPKSLEDELDVIQTNVKNSMRKSSSALELFRGKQYRKAVIIAAGLKLTSIMTGPITIQQYLGRIMQESRANISLKIVLIIFGVVKFIVSFMSSILVDRVGRRPLLSYSLFGTFICLTIVGTYFFLLEQIQIDQTYLTFYGLIAFACIVVSNVISVLGYNSVTFVVPAEIFPVNVKAIALTSLNIFGGILSFITTLAYQKIINLSGLYGPFWSFAAVALIGALFVVLYVPETKGKSLEEIQLMLQGHIDKEEESGVQLKPIVNGDCKDSDNETDRLNQEKST